MRPKFDPKEEYLIAYYRNSTSAGTKKNWLYDLAVLVVGAGLFVFGLLRAGDPTWSIIGFGLVAYRLIQLTLASGSYEGTFAGIIEKYEAALEEQDGNTAPSLLASGGDAPVEPGD
ncbi:hypothetical protein HAHE_06900 [Haloferula helveola]|uniref:Uncharacterized protein n=1 Tax=Haloferula helveola TaxID=490095 RepID=A0ABN6GZR9_9BACT|nr:hypothetical protein HAHE_06900 [Haloferula helveola]